ncbi:MAG TPA: sigma factor-like helix-turn-helix DNA-binding protein [Solirubrobacteraceae bacterium]|nr:sigma factor-like helix-turn-helix DNA-binding protein [Solirubrobacteraceae bacterium]
MRFPASTHTERHIEMLRPRLLDGLPLHEIGKRTGVSGGRVQQILRGCV